MGIGEAGPSNTHNSAKLEHAAPENRQNWVGRSVERKEDAALLMGAGRYADDVPAPAGTLHAAIVRAPVAHALIKNIDVSRALALPGVHHVLTGEDIRAISDPFLIVLKKPINQWSLAVERIRFAGEAVALHASRQRRADQTDADQRDVVEDRRVHAVSPTFHQVQHLNLQAFLQVQIMKHNSSLLIHTNLQLLVSLLTEASCDNVS